MYSAQIANSRGAKISLTGNETNWQVVSIIGLSPPKAQINTNTVAGMDGAKFNSSKLLTRNIVITLKLNGEVEANRVMLYQYFPTKDSCTFYYQNDHRDVYIEGWIESVECNFFSNAEVMQISILCPQPYFKALDEIVTDISKVTPRFTFPFSINIGSPVVISSLDVSRVTDIINDSTGETGMIIEITFLDDISEVDIINTETGEHFALTYQFTTDDVVTINTNKGQKSVKLTRDGATTDIFAAIELGSTFFQLRPGDNFFSYTLNAGAADTDVNIVFKHYTIYRGV